MSKHTPAPWKVIDREILEDGSVYPIHITGGVTELQVCLLESSQAARAYTYDESWKAMGRTDMQQANARLIAAAPELLEALTQLEAYASTFSHDSTGHKKLIEARAAIAKATGEQA